MSMDTTDTTEFERHGDNLVRHPARWKKNLDPNFVKGCEAICFPEFSFILKSYDECSYCTVKTLRKIFDHCEVVEDDDGGVLAVCKGIPYVWFPETPTHCTCKL